MAEPFLSEIRIFSFNFAPKSWALCNGQLLPINQNQALFSLLGTTYGGNGQTTFALPDLRGQVPTHIGGGNVLGAKGGTSSVTITQSTMPQHLHFGQGTSNSSGNVATPGNALLAASNVTIYGPPAALVALDPSSVANVGGSQAHENRQPYLVLNFCIALQGIFPSQN
ncbi:MAG: phage tail protein [Pyrinomonadaceae bacterium]